MRQHNGHHNGSKSKPSAEIIRKISDIHDNWKPIQFFVCICSPSPRYVMLLQEKHKRRRKRKFWKSLHIPFWPSCRRATLSMMEKPCYCWQLQKRENSLTRPALFVPRNWKLTGRSWPVMCHYRLGSSQGRIVSKEEKLARKEGILSKS